jgi:hypothetical protein
MPLYHGAYQARMQAIDARLARLPGVHLVASYRGGVSVRDRITSGYTAAQRIAVELGSALPMTAVYSNHIGLKLEEGVTI